MSAGGHESVTVKRTIVLFSLVLSNRLKCASVLEEVTEVGSPFQITLIDKILLLGYARLILFVHLVTCVMCGWGTQQSTLQ